MIGKLGALPPNNDPNTLRFARYVEAATLPPPPTSIDYTKKVTLWGMMVNDQLGCCTCSTAGHSIQVWTGNHSTQVTIADSEIVKAYAAVSGYNPSTGAGDNGAVETDLLNYWRKTGIGGHKIGAYVAVHPQTPTEVREALWLFGSLYIGVALPLAAQQQQVWSAARRTGPFSKLGHQWEAGSWGGHAVNIVAYDVNGLTCVTWGALKRMTWAFFHNYVQEAYAILTPDWVDGSKPAPNGFDIATLTKDLSMV